MYLFLTESRQTCLSIYFYIDISEEQKLQILRLHSIVSRISVLISPLVNRADSSIFQSSSRIESSVIGIV